MNREATVKPGTRLYSPHTACEIVVVRPPRHEVTVTCDGRPMSTERPDRDLDPDDVTGRTEIGKRYVHAASGLEVLCTRGGNGELAADGVSLERLEAKPLPSSD